MKLCPQCAFIYEDAQTICDMDGNKLVAGPAPVVSEAKSSPSRLTIDLPPKPSSKRSTALAIVVGLAFAFLLTGGYVAQRMWRSQSAFAQIPPQVANAPAAQPDTTSDASLKAQVSAQASTEDTSNNESSSDEEQTRSDLGNASRVRSISSGGLTGASQRPVLLRLANGATIRADEVWERKEGVWYRQGGLITFLKRSQVRAIERPSAVVPAKSTAVNQRTQVASAQTQPRPAKAQIVTVKKDSKVTSLIKKTGRILKKPFRF